MTKERIKTYTLRVSQASKSGMVVILYDVVIDSIRAAEQDLKEGDVKTFHEDINCAGKFLNELIKSLDLSVALSYNLLSLYMYVQKMIARSAAREDEEDLDAMIDILTKLKVGFEGIEENMHEEPMMSNVQQVYAGLTYGRGHLNESYINVSDYNRGFIA